MELARLPIGELRRRFLSEGRRVRARELAALEADTRAGARELGRALRERRRRSERERRRTSRLYRLERERWRDGLASLAGVDEVGVGPLAGPVVAAAVVLAREPVILGLDDSKKLPAERRESLAREIRECAVAVRIGAASRAEIDRLNIYQAGLLAMRRAVAALDPAPELVLVDGRSIPRLPHTQRAVAGGDATVASIAAASIVAKVYRDRWMAQLDRRYPGYGFAHNRGYGTAEHLSALRKWGPTPEHRRSFAPVREAVLVPSAAEEGLG